MAYKKYILIYDSDKKILKFAEIQCRFRMNKKTIERYGVILKA